MTSPFRPNPAKDDYPLQKLMGRITATYHQVTRVAADSHQPSVSTSDPGTPGVADSVIIDPSNPHLAIWTSATLTGTEHVADLPISTLLIIDPTNSHLGVLPTLST